jgi:hypothetical protein
VAGKPVCNACVEQIRARVAGSIQPAPAAQPTYVAAPPNPARLLAGIVAGIVAGAIGAFVWDKFVFYTGIEFGLIASGIGWAVGVAIVIGSGGHHGIVPALFGAVIAFCAIIFGEYLLAQDQIAKAGLSFISGRVDIPFVVKHLDVMTWVFVAIGVYGGFQVPMGARRQQ